MSFNENEYLIQRIRAMKTRFSLLLCAFIISITTHAQIIKSEPSGAKVYFEGSYLGKTPLKLGETSFPYDLVYKIRRDKVDDISKPPYVYVLTLKMDGYEEQSLRIIGEWKHISKYRDLDCVAGLKSGNNYTVVMEKIDMPLFQDEPTDIHWGIDSDPSGARVFWKVNSSIPSAIKSTEYMYLGITPIDLNKPLNIKGLDSENSRNVMVEIKIQSKGFKTQTKTFSAELLTEQNEISWFFELEEE